MSEQKPLSGSCLCGKVCLSINELERQVVACHCTQCRKQTGHFVAATRVANDHLVIQGEQNLTWFSASADAERGFCRHCGSVMLWRRFGAQHTSIMAGCLDSPTGLKIEKHIFTDNKGDYYALEPDIPAFARSD